MRRPALITLAILVALLLATQLVLPGYLAGRVDDDLADAGGKVDVSLSAVPALTLLAGRGDTIRIEGEGQILDLSAPRARALERLDGFAHVNMRLDRVDAGPLQIRALTLRRDGRDEPYRFAMRAVTTPRELAQELGSRTDGLFGSVAAGLASDSLPDDGRRRLPFEVDVSLRSKDGRPDVTDASGTVAGFPTGPLAEIVVNAVLVRL